MAVKVKGTPAGIKNLLSGAGGSGALVNGGSAPSRESRNKIKVDQSPSAVPKRPSGGASTAKRAPKPNAISGGGGGTRGVKAVLSEPTAFGQPYSM